MCLALLYLSLSLSRISSQYDAMHLYTNANCSHKIILDEEYSVLDRVLDWSLYTGQYFVNGKMRTHARRPHQTNWQNHVHILALVSQSVQQILCLMLISELICSEIRNSEFAVSEHRIWMCLINSDCLPLELTAYNTTFKSQYQWISDLMNHHGNREEDSEFEQIVRKKCSTAAAAKDRETAWENIAARSMLNSL